MKTERATLAICEIFGPTVQGEGELIGLPTVFVRTGGCDFQCRWCDTLYAVQARFRHQWSAMTDEQVLDRIRALSGDRPLMVSLSGGNPALQPLAGLVALGKAEGFGFTLETQGSIAKPWFCELDLLTLSPKPPSSGMECDIGRLDECVLAAGTARTVLKFVVADDDDYRHARKVAERFPSLPVYLQPCNPNPTGDADPQELQGRLRRLVDRVVADGWFRARVLPQLHVLLWGNSRGV